jgi:hypothetical protein
MQQATACLCTAVGLIDRFARCFRDSRSKELIEHKAAMVGQRIFGIALGYEDVVNHDELRHDPIMAMLAGKLVAHRKNCAPVAGKSTLNRLELATNKPTAYHKIGHDPQAIEDLFVDLFLEAHRRAPRQIILDLDATDDPLYGHQEGRFFLGYYDCYCYLPLYIFSGRHLLAAKPLPQQLRRHSGIVGEELGEDWLRRALPHRRRRRECREEQQCNGAAPGTEPATRTAGSCYIARSQHDGSLDRRAALR